MDKLQPIKKKHVKTVKSVEKSKRNLAKAAGIIGAGALVWKKPVVNAVTLPAHAEATDVVIPMRQFFGDAEILSTSTQSASSDSLIAAISDKVVTQAFAQETRTRGAACAMEVEGGVELQFQNVANSVLRTGVLPLSGAAVDLNNEFSPNGPCIERVRQARLISISDNDFVFEYNHAREGWTEYRILRSNVCDLPPLDGSCNGG